MNVFWSLSSDDDDHEVLYFYLCVSEEKTNQLMKRGERLLIDLLINYTFSKLILSLNFKTVKGLL